MRQFILASVSTIALTLGGIGPALAAGGTSGSSSGSHATHRGQTQSVSQDEVKQAQEKLKSDGLYNGQIDGKIGPETKQALSQYQEKNGLRKTATLDHETLQKLMGNQQPGQNTGSGSSNPPSGGNQPNTGGGSSNQQQ